MRVRLKSETGRNRNFVGRRGVAYGANGFVTQAKLDALGGVALLDRVVVKKIGVSHGSFLPVCCIFSFLSRIPRHRGMINVCPWRTLWGLDNVFRFAS